jgi:hypothetical protein
MNWIKTNWYKILAMIILFGALGDQQYGYYQLLRFGITIISGYLAYLEHSSQRKVWFGVFIAIAILFNPIMPIYLNKDTWQVLDLITAIVFIVSIFFNFYVPKKETGN